MLVFVALSSLLIFGYINQNYYSINGILVQVEAEKERLIAFSSVFGLTFIDGHATQFFF